MEEEKKKVNMIMAGLRFKGSEIGEVCENEKNTLPAILLIAFSVLMGVVIAYFKGNGGSSGFGRTGYVGFQAATAEMGSLLIGTFLSALIMVFVLRIFKVKPTYSAILRLYGSAIIWTIIKIFLGFVLPLFLPPKVAMIGVLFWFAFNFSVLFGLTGYLKIKLWKSFLSIVITFAFVFGFVNLYGFILKSIFV